MAVVDRGERRDRVDEEQCRVPGAVDRLAQLADARGDARRGLVMDGGDGLDPVLLVLAELRLQRRGIDAAAPVAGHEIDLEAEPARHLAPQRREMAGLE